MKTNNVGLGSVISILLVTVGLLSALMLGLLVKSNQTADGEVIGSNNSSFKYYHQEIGEITSVLTETEHMVYSLHYPKFSQDEIDVDINQIVMQIIQDAENEKQESNSTDERGMVYMNYDSYLVGQNIVSIIFYLEYNSNELINPTKYMISKHYDLSTGGKLSDDELFQGDYLSALSSYCSSYLKGLREWKDLVDTESFQQAISPEAENYQNLSLTNDGVLVTFTKEQIFTETKEVQIEIPYEVMKEYLTFDYTSCNIVIEDKKENVIEETKIPDIDRNKPMIALTFDDGPNPSVTNRILDALKEYESRATFFIVGNRLHNYPDTLQRIVSENSELGSHTYHHKSLILLNPKEIKKELSAVDQYLEELLGFGATTLRPPYGEVNDVVIETVKKPLIYWSIDTEDWKDKNADRIVETVMSQVQDGDIILFHDLYDTTAEAIELLVPKLIAEGYQLVTVSELFKAKGIPLEDGNVYYHAR